MLEPGVDHPHDEALLRLGTAALDLAVVGDAADDDVGVGMPVL